MSDNFKNSSANWLSIAKVRVIYAKVKSGWTVHFDKVRYRERKEKAPWIKITGRGRTKSLALRDLFSEANCQKCETGKGNFNMPHYRGML